MTPYTIEVHKTDDDTYVIVGRAVDLPRAKRLVGTLVTDTVIITQEGSCSSQRPSSTPSSSQRSCSGLVPLSGETGDGETNEPTV